LLSVAEPQSTPLSSDGLYFSNFETPEGRVTVILPADLQAGDTLSGTVWSGEARAGGADLSGYVLEVDDRRIDASAPAFTHTVPEGSSKPVRVRLLSPQGRSVGEAVLPLVQPVPEPPSVGDFTAPSLVQAGQPIQIKGPFSGDVDASRLSVGGTAARPLAQSPRNGWWQVPPEVTGRAEVELVQDGGMRGGQVRSVGAQLSADRLDLQRGETTTMRVDVAGLEGLERPVPLTVTNESPSTVELEGGDAQTVEIPPSEVSPEGRWQTSRTVTGRTRGSFNLRVRATPGTGWPWVVLDLEPPPIPIQAPPERPRVRSLDTNEDKKDDLDVRSWDFNGDGKPDKIHFDTDRDGRIDDGERVVEGIQKYRHQLTNRDGFKFELTVSAGPGQVVVRTIFIKDANGDGDTADPGEVKE
jgi:hypothetical protein